MDKIKGEARQAAPHPSPLLPPSIVIDMFALRGNSGGNNPRAFEKLLNLPGRLGGKFERGCSSSRKKFPLLHTEKRVSSWIEKSREISRDSLYTSRKLTSQEYSNPREQNFPVCPNFAGIFSRDSRAPRPSGKGIHSSARDSRTSLKHNGPI